MPSIDRMFLQAWVPKLQSVWPVCRFLAAPRVQHPLGAAFGKLGDAYVAELHRWTRDNGVPVTYFEKGDNKEAITKEAIARPLIDAAAAEGGDGRVVLVGIAQEKASAWRS